MNRTCPFLNGERQLWARACTRASVRWAWPRSPLQQRGKGAHYVRIGALQGRCRRHMKGAHMQVGPAGSREHTYLTVCCFNLRCCLRACHCQHYSACPDVTPTPATALSERDIVAALHIVWALRGRPSPFYENNIWAPSQKIIFGHRVGAQL